MSQTAKANQFLVKILLNTKLVYLVAWIAQTGNNRMSLPIEIDGKKFLITIGFDRIEQE